VKSLSSGSSNIFIGFLVMIPSLVGLAAMILISRRSDRTLERRYHVAIPAISGGLALVLLGPAHSTFLTVALLSFVAIGVYGFFGPFWALPSGFLTGFSAAAGLALINSVGNLSGFVGPYAIGTISRTTGSLPRTSEPMRLVNHLYFVAEHDDHHLATISEIVDAGTKPK
jgi:ACS family tartrate transporter-like MFS transporter